MYTTKKVFFDENIREENSYRIISMEVPCQGFPTTFFPSF